MHRRIALLLGLICAGQAFAALTTVQDTLYTASGSYCSGTLTLTWQTFTAPDGHLIQGGSFTSTVAASVNGLSVTIEPGQYTASYQLTPNLCAPAYEQWLVPTSGSPVTLAQVRSINPPTPYALFSPGYIAQDGATPGQGLCWTGSMWLPGACTWGGSGLPFLQPSSYSGSLPATIAALPANGGEIDLACNTTYTISASLSITVPTLIRGCAGSTMIQLIAGYSATSMMSLSAGVTLQLENLTLDGNRLHNGTMQSAVIYVNASGAKVISHGVTYQNFNFNTIFSLNNSSNNLVDGNQFVNNAQHVIMSDATSFLGTKNHFTNNNFTFSAQNISSISNTTPAVVTLVSAQPLSSLQYISIRNTSNSAYNAQWAITPIGAGPTYSSFSLNGSTASGASSGGAYIEGGWSVQINNEGWDVVANNTTFGGATETIAISGCQYATVTGNTSTWSGDSGITLTAGSVHNVIADNTINYSWWEGILVSDSTTGTSANVIAENVIFSVQNSTTPRQVGITINGSHAVTNIVRGGNAGGPQYGVFVGNGALNTRIENVELAGSLGPFYHDGTDAGTTVIDHTGQFTFAAINASASSYGNGSSIFCADCNSTCSAGSSTGMACFRQNGGWSPLGGGSGSIASTTNALVGNGAGAAIAASGTGSNCVHVDGSSATCGGGGGSTTDLREFKTLCENTVAGGNFDLVAGTNMPQYNCHAGLSNTEFGTLDFPGAATGTQGAAIFHTQMPNSWTSVVFDLSWLSSDASSGVSATWYLQIACVAATGASLDPTWDSARSYSSANQATANYSNAISSQTLTLPGACTSGTPGPMLFARIYRNGSDTLGSSYAASLVSARLTIVHP